VSGISAIENVCACTEPVAKHHRAKVAAVNNQRRLLFMSACSLKVGG
jgi:hypothetical protein